MIWKSDSPRRFARLRKQQRKLQPSQEFAQQNRGNILRCRLHRVDTMKQIILIRTVVTGGRSSSVFLPTQRC